MGIRDEVDELLPLKPAVFEILLTLADGENHGYAILHEVHERTDEAVRLLPGTLYRFLHRLADDGLLVEVDGPSVLDDPDGRKRYYRLTELGREVVAAEARRLDAALETARAKKVLESRP